MKDYTLDDLKNQIEKAEDTDSKRRRSRYALAKSLGFSAYEAKVLMFKTEDVIRRLANENITRQES